MSDKFIQFDMEQLQLSVEDDAGEALENMINSFGKEYHNVDKMMDALNSALDNLESQSDALYQEAKNILELSRREQLQEKTNESESYNQTDCNTDSSNTDSSNTDNSNTGSSVVPGEHSNDASISNSLFVSTGGNASTSNTSSSTSEACSNRLSVQEADSEEPSKLESAD